MTVISLVKHTFHFYSLSDYNLRILIDVKKKSSKNQIMSAEILPLLFMNFSAFILDPRYKQQSTNCFSKTTFQEPYCTFVLSDNFVYVHRNLNWIAQFCRKYLSLYII